MAPGPKAERRDINAIPVARFPGAPLMPTGDPMLDGVGPGAYAIRADTPDLTFEGDPKIVPLRVVPDFYLEPRDPDPRGMTVIGADGKAAGTVVDCWIDRSEYIMRYLEVELPAAVPVREAPQTSNAASSAPPPSAPGRALLPINFCRIDAKARRIRVKAILAGQFAGVPGLASPDTITFMEEERVVAYYGGGTLYATARRQEPLL